MSSQESSNKYQTDSLEMGEEQSNYQQTPSSLKSLSFTQNSNDL